MNGYDDATVKRTQEFLSLVASLSPAQQDVIADYLRRAAALPGEGAEREAQLHALLLEMQAELTQ